LGYKPELTDIFKNINELVRFGEAKNSGFIALNVGMIITIYANYNVLTNYFFTAGLIFASFMFCSAIIMSLSSLFPVTRNTISEKDRHENPNLYFCGDLAKLDLATFVWYMKKEDPEFEPTKMQEDIINQILINSRIAMGKFKFFKFSVTFTITGISVLALSFLGKGALKLIAEGF
jgi:hypothetical protein